MVDNKIPPKVHAHHWVAKAIVVGKVFGVFLHHKGSRGLIVEKVMVVAGHCGVNGLQRTGLKTGEVKHVFAGLEYFPWNLEEIVFFSSFAVIRFRGEVHIAYWNTQIEGGITVMNFVQQGIFDDFDLHSRPSKYQCRAEKQGGKDIPTKLVPKVGHCAWRDAPTYLLFVGWRDMHLRYHGFIYANQCLVGHEDKGDQ